MIQGSQNITLVGSGLAGPLLAISLVKRGYRVRIFERRPDMRKVRISAGRSINLALSTRGIHALKEAGLWAEMQKIVIPMKGRMMHSVAGELTFQPYGKDESEVINSISRAELNMALMTAAEGTSVITETVFESRFMHVPELSRMGANVTIHHESALVRGVPQLRGADAMATDLRASVSLAIAALAAEGDTTINRVYHLDRGYERLEDKLAACGADIERLKR